MGKDFYLAENHQVIKVAIAIPNNGYTQVESYENRLQNMLHLGILQERCKQENRPIQYEFAFFVQGRLYTPLAREEAAKHALNGNCDYLLFIDDDMICPHDMFEKMIAHDVDIVGALAFTRNPPHKAVMYSCVDGYDPITRQNYFINHYVLNYPKGKLVECDAIGFGCVLIKMDVFKTIPQPWFALCSNSGEDITFCYEAKKHGFRVFMDTALPVGHLGNPICVTEDYARNYWKTAGLEYEKTAGLYKKYEEKSTT